MCEGDPGETHDLARRFLRVMEVLNKLTHYPSPASAALQMSINHLRALHLIHQEPGIVQKELAERLNITPAAVSTAVQNMESLGLVERRKPPKAHGDARLVCLYLSEEGQNLIMETQARRCQAAAELLKVLPIEEQRLIVGALERAMSAKQESFVNRS